MVFMMSILKQNDHQIDFQGNLNIFFGVGNRPIFAPNVSKEGL